METLKNYECTVLFSPSLLKEEILKEEERYKKLIEERGGETVEAEKIGKRRLTYKVKHSLEGYYLVFKFRSKSASIVELERQLRLDENVLRYLTVRVDKFSEAKQDKSVLSTGEKEEVKANG